MGSRISYSYDEDFPGQFGLWQGNCQRSLAGKAGQKFLIELEAALSALPSKRLIVEALEDSNGDVCAFGALPKARGESIDPDLNERSEWAMEDVGEEMGAPRMVAWKIVEQNDNDWYGSRFECAGPNWFGSAGYHIHFPETPEQRYERILAWVRSQIKAVAA